MDSSAVHSVQRREIDTELDRCARSAVPDYAGFDEWLASRLTGQLQKSLIFPRLRTNTGAQAADYLGALLELHRNHSETLQAAMNTQDDAYRCVNFNKFKLLMHATGALPARSKEAFALDKGRIASLERLDEDIAQCSQSELRARFFAAIQRHEDRAAIKLLARLHEEAHDPGELEYLEALCSFEADEYADTIRWARKTPATAIDYPSARALILEALAYQGQAKELIEEFQPNTLKDIPPSFLAHLLQVTLQHSVDPDQVLQQINDCAAHWRTATSEEDPFLASFNRFSCRLAKTFVQHLNEQEFHDREYVAAVRQQPEEGEAQLDLRAKQLFYACMFDNTLLNEILNAPANERDVPIVKRLINTPYQPSPDDFIEALRTQWELGATRFFVENVIANLHGLLTMANEDIWELIELAYAEASAPCRELHVWTSTPPITSPWPDCAMNSPGPVGTSTNKQAGCMSVHAKSNPIFLD